MTSAEKEITADDILAESDDDDEEDNGSQASGDAQIKLTDPQRMKQEIEESRARELQQQQSAASNGSDLTALGPEDLRNRSDGLALEAAGKERKEEPEDGGGADDRKKSGAGAVMLGDGDEGSDGEQDDDAAGPKRGGATVDDDGRRRAGAITMQTDVRKSKDDTTLREPLGGHHHPDPEMKRLRANSKGRMTRTFTVGDATAGHGQEEENQIFAEDLNIAQSPARVDIDKRTCSRGENDENLLDRIMNESDESSSED